MARIYQVQVNGQIASETQAPVVEGLRPLITWEYDGRDENQRDFQLRLSSASTNWGTDTFGYEVYFRNWSSPAESSSNFFQYPKSNLSRGAIYYAQIAAINELGVSTGWVQFQFAINQLPVAASVHILPAIPNMSDYLEVLYEYSDADGHEETGTKVRWLKNNIHQPAYDDLCVLPSSSLAIGDSWSATVTPCDGLEYGLTAETAAVTIAAPPQSTDIFYSIKILPSGANVDDILKVEYTLKENEYATNDGIVDFAWYVNDALVFSGSQEYVRLQMSPSDTVYVVAYYRENGILLGQMQSETISIADVDWHVYDLEVDGLRKVRALTDLSPEINWKLYKTTSEESDLPQYLSIKVTKTPGLDNPVWDSGYVEYTRSSYVIPDGVLRRGRDYYVHVSAGDTTPMSRSAYASLPIRMSGSVWAEDVNNTIGWTIECKLELVDPTENNSHGLYIHDGTRYCAIFFFPRKVRFVSDSDNVVEYEYQINQSSLANHPKTFRISAANNDLVVMMDNDLVIDAHGMFVFPTRTKAVEFGDISKAKISDEAPGTTANWYMFKYSTQGAYDLGTLAGYDQIEFYEVGQLKGGSITDYNGELMTWTPDDQSNASRVVSFDPEGNEATIPTVTKNYSPVTCIHVDKSRNKYVGTSQGVTAIYGDKHDPDYHLTTTDVEGKISQQDFDRISTVPRDKIALAEPSYKPGWFTIDTTYRSVGEVVQSVSYQQKELHVGCLQESRQGSINYLPTSATMAWLRNALSAVGYDKNIQIRYHETSLLTHAFLANVDIMFVAMDKGDGSTLITGLDAGEREAIQWFSQNGGKILGLLSTVNSTSRDVQNDGLLTSFGMASSGLESINFPCTVVRGGYASITDGPYGVLDGTNSTQFLIPGATQPITVTSISDLGDQGSVILRNEGVSPFVNLVVATSSGVFLTYRFFGDIFIKNVIYQLIDSFNANLLSEYYDPYVTEETIRSHAIHYYSQRAPGHAWFDKVDNTKGWQVAFDFKLDVAEQDDAVNFTPTLDFPHFGDLNVTKVIAHSIREFSQTQGVNGWEYGYSTTLYNGSNFVQCELYLNGEWYPNTESSVRVSSCKLTSSNGGPAETMPGQSGTGILGLEGDVELMGINATHWAIKQWTSDFSGNILIFGSFNRSVWNQGAGITLRIFKNGVSLHTYLGGGNYAVNNFSLETSVVPGDKIAFVIDPRQSDSTDYVLCTAEIVVNETQIIAGFEVADTAVVREGVICLSNEHWRGLAGDVWFETKVQAKHGFQADFRYSCEAGCYGVGDGFAFVMHGNATPDPGHGYGGPYLGYAGYDDAHPGISNSIAVEFDLTKNTSLNDPNDNHISIQSRGLSYNMANHVYSLGQASNINSLIGEHRVRIKYMPGFMQVFVDDMLVPLVTAQVNLSSLLSIDDGAYVGITAGTSSESERLEIKDFTYSEAAPSLAHRHGFGVYVNDGIYQEVIYFYPDRLRLYNANVFMPLDTRVSRKYRIVGKGKNLFIYEKPDDGNAVGAWRMIVNGAGLFTTPASLAANARHPRIAVDSNGDCHCVWHDDGNSRSRIFYSKYTSGVWSAPELATSSTQFDLRNPELAIDEYNRVWVVYEDTSWGFTEIACSVRDSQGWNPKIRLTNFKSNKRNPVVVAVPTGDVHVVWEDNRNGHWNIFWAQWKNDAKAWNSSGQFGSDTCIATQYDGNDASLDATDFQKPRLVCAYPRLWMVCEGRDPSLNVSAIYMGSYDIEEKYWNSIGSEVLDADGNYLAKGTSQLVSRSDGMCIHPVIAVSASEPHVMVVVWEDHTVSIWSNPVNSYLFGAVYNDVGHRLNGPELITPDTPKDALNPTIGFHGTRANIVYTCDEKLYIAAWDKSIWDWISPGILLYGNAEQTALSVSVPLSAPTTNFKTVYEYERVPEPWLDQKETEYFASIADIDTIYTTEGLSAGSPMVIGGGDTREFAFGDISENVGIIAHWRNFQMYFGYDARPLSVVRYSQETIAGFPDNRINSIFADAYGNLVIGTFGGLVFYNVYTGQLVPIEAGDNGLFKNNIITVVAWGQNGVWYVGTNDGLYYTYTAGQSWAKAPLTYTPLGGSAVTNIVTYGIAVSKAGDAIVATERGVFVYNPLSNPTGFTHLDFTDRVSGFDGVVRSVAIDDANVIWAGTDVGLVRLDNFSVDSLMLFTKQQGMRCNYITSIAIVNRYLRFIGTANGIHRMHGSHFYDLTAHTHDILNNNISALYWEASTGSLWVGCLHQLHEIVFRDPEYEIIKDEVTHYSGGAANLPAEQQVTEGCELSTQSYYEKRRFDLLDLYTLPSGLDIQSETIKVYVNKNEIDFGYFLGETQDNVQFLCDMLADDEVTVQVSDKFKVLWRLDSGVTPKKTGFTLGLCASGPSAGTGPTGASGPTGSSGPTGASGPFGCDGRRLVLTESAGGDALLVYAGKYRLPFTTILLDRDKPTGCLKLIEFLSGGQAKFKLDASDETSGVEGYILSDYANFTSDGDTPLDFQSIPSDGVVYHTIDMNQAQTLTMYEFESGTGSQIVERTDSQGLVSLYAATSLPGAIYRYALNISTQAWEWNRVSTLDDDVARQVHRLFVYNGTVFALTGKSGGSGKLYVSIDGETFRFVTGTPAEHFRAIAASDGGLVWIGDSDGNIWRYAEVDGALTCSKVYTNIGTDCYALTAWKEFIIAATANRGQLIMIDTSKTEPNTLIIYDGTETALNHVMVLDSTVETARDVKLYMASNETTSIYRGNLEDLSFSKSYASYGNDFGALKPLDLTVLGGLSLAATASVADRLYKHTGTNWEYIYRHEDTIRDYTVSGVGGAASLWVVTDGKVSKRVAGTVTKTVYLKLRDRAGNETDTPVVDPDHPCPDPTLAQSDPMYRKCCNLLYSITLEELRSYVGDSNIVNIDEDGNVIFSRNSPNGRVFYSAEMIDEEMGIYTSEILNGTNDLVSWKSMWWGSDEPTGTSIDMQIRYAATEDGVLDADWSPNLVKGLNGLVDLTHVTSQYIQFRAILRSQVRNLSPSLSSVVLRNITSQSSHFFTTNFVLPGRIRKGLLTTNTFIPVTADVVFGVSTKNSVDFGDYQVVEPNRIFSTNSAQFGNNMRVGVKLLSPALAQLNPSQNPGDPYDAASYVCDIGFYHRNLTGVDHNFHYRVKFYNDPYRTQKIYEFFTGNDQTGWSYNELSENLFPATGLPVPNGEIVFVSFKPLGLVDSDQRWYVTVEADDGEDDPVVVSNDMSYICASSAIDNHPGLVSDYYRTGLSDLTSIPTFGGLVPEYSRAETGINFGVAIGQPWRTSSGEILTNLTENYAARFKAKLQIPESGTYGFQLKSCDGSILYLRSEEILNLDGRHAFTTSDIENVYLTQGLHDIEVHYFKGPAILGTAARLELYWIPPGEVIPSLIPAQRFFHAVVSEYGEGNLPIVYNFAIMFELENGETIQLNLSGPPGVLGPSGSGSSGASESGESGVIGSTGAGATSA